MKNKDSGLSASPPPPSKMGGMPFSKWYFWDLYLIDIKKDNFGSLTWSDIKLSRLPLMICSALIHRIETSNVPAVLYCTVLYCTGENIRSGSVGREENTCPWK